MNKARAIDKVQATGAANNKPAITSENYDTQGLNGGRRRPDRRGGRQRRSAELRVNNAWPTADAPIHGQMDGRIIRLDEVKWGRYYITGFRAKGQLLSLVCPPPPPRSLLLSAARRS